MKTEKWYRVELPFACFGFVATNDVIVDSAPIGRKFIGQNVRNIEKWAKSKNGKVEELINASSWIEDCLNSIGKE